MQSVGGMINVYGPYCFNIEPFVLANTHYCFILVKGATFLVSKSAVHHELLIKFCLGVPLILFYFRAFTF